jgi:colanic acid/amylovoran biosynthesis protein
MKKVLFMGANFRNKGSVAMLISTLESFKILIPDAEFCLASSFPVRERDYEKAKNYGLRIFEYRFSRKDGLRYLKSLGSMVSELMDTNVVVDLSGFFFSDKGRKTGMLIKGLTIMMCKLFRKPVVLYSQSFGPFNSKFSRVFCKLCLQRANIIVARGKISFRHLYGLGIRKNVKVRFGSAFLLEPASQKRLNEILKIENIEKRKDVLKIGIAVNIRIYERTKGTGTENHYVNIMAQLSDFLVENLNSELVFVPYEFSYKSTMKGYDDRFVGRLIYMKAKNKHRIQLIENEYGPKELKALTQIFDLFIGCRFHSIVASTSMCVPTITIGWSQKYLGMMEMLGQAKYVCDYRDLSLNRLINLVNDALYRKEEVKNELEAKMKEVKKSAFESAKLVAKMID